jgi:hypothetical protein
MYNRSSALRCIATALMVAVAGVAQAQISSSSVILSNEYGEQATIGAAEDLRESLEAVALSGADIAAEFKRLCLDTAMNEQAFAAAVSASTWGLNRTETILPAAGRRPEVRMVDYRSPSAIASLWTGTNAEGLRGRPYASRSRGVTRTGPVSVRDLYAPQCNLSIKARGLTDAGPLTAALEGAIGAPATRLVLRGGFADGHWELRDGSAPGRRVTFAVVDLRRATQLVHLTVQILPPESD